MLARALELEQPPRQVPDSTHSVSRPPDPEPRSPLVSKPEPQAPRPSESSSPPAALSISPQLVRRWSHLGLRRGAGAGGCGMDTPHTGADVIVDARGAL